MRRIIVPTDFSDTAKNAARYAAQLADSIPGATIILYNLTDKIALGSDSSPLTEDRNDRFTVLQAALNNLKAELSEVAQVPVESVVEEGSSLTECLQRYVRHHGIDMIVMGSNNRLKGMSKLKALGSVTRKVSEMAHCPVLIVH